MVDKTTYIEKFKKLHEKKTGEILSDQDALGYFEQLVVLVEATYKPIPQKNYGKREGEKCPRGIH